MDDIGSAPAKTNCATGSHGLKIGTCGFGLAKKAYARAFSCVEVQQTFYQPPQIRTLERWRNEVPEKFEFTLKAWQLITHDARSPTYRRLKRSLSNVEKEESGYFRPTRTVAEAWQTTLASARALKARTILFQCPASFKQTDENIANLSSFFNSIDRSDLQLCWEPRGDWQPLVVSSICTQLRLCHVVDPFLAKTETPNTYYFRLHGKNGWRYEYDVRELEEFATELRKLDQGYVFFNNSKMTEDALKFCQLLKDRDS